MESLIVNVPPYCGAPRVSHQLPVLLVVAVTEIGAVVVEVVVDTIAVLDVVVVELLVVVAVVVVDEPQDANTID